MKMFRNKCDQMVRLFFIICPYATMKISQIMSQICQSRFQHFAKLETNSQIFAKYFKLLPKWQNFAKSGHTGSSLELVKVNSNFHFCHFSKLFEMCAFPENK